MTVRNSNRGKLIGQAKPGRFKPGGLGGKFRSKLKGYGSKTTGSKRKNVKGYGSTNKKKQTTKVKKPMPSPGLMGAIATGRVTKRSMGGKVIKRSRGGMAYQLYGGSSKNIHNGNKEVSQFYDTKN